MLLRYFCSEQFQNTALYPVISQIRHGAGFAENDTSDERLDKLSRLLMAGLPPDELAAAMPYFAALLSVPTAGRYPASGDSPERQRELTLRALLSIFVALSRERPLLVLFEDLHWADHGSRDFLRFLARQLADRRILVAATYRSDELHRRHPLYTLLPVLVRESGVERCAHDARQFRCFADFQHLAAEAISQRPQRSELRV